MRIGVLTGGGDVPGLNAAIRAVVRRSLQYGYEVVGLKDGWAGLIKGDTMPLTLEAISGILHVGGTILGSSRTNPFKKEENVQKCLDNFRQLGLDALIAIGGEDTLGVALKFYRKGLPMVGIPKTMDNDVGETDYCIGFDTAVSTVTLALDKLHTTACSHHRVLVVEVMGRHAGWVAVIGGMAGGADYIFIPEVKASMDDVCEHLKERWDRGKTFAIVVVAEGAQIEGLPEEKELKTVDEFGHVYLAHRSLGERVAREIKKRLGFETRHVVLGHLQRGGIPTTFDRVLATRLGVKAVDLVKEGKFGYMAALKGNQIVPVPLEDALATLKTVDLELYRIAQIFT